MIIVWFLLWLALVIVVSVVAAKRGRSGVLVLVLTVVASPAMVAFASAAGVKGDVELGLVFFAAPAIALLFVLVARTSEQVAADEGSHGRLRKCPFCAEVVRAEAIKCKHCGSELTAQQPR